MNQIYPDAGLVASLQRIATPSLHCHLYDNNLVPDRSTTLGTLHEASFGGYAIQTVPVASFTLTGVVAHVGGIQALPVAFANTSGGPQQAYGYYVTDETDTYLVAVARFDAAPVTIPDGGNQLVVPVLGDYSALSS
jgi:hypothetical protein